MIEKDQINTYIFKSVRRPKNGHKVKYKVPKLNIKTRTLFLDDFSLLFECGRVAKKVCRLAKSDCCVNTSGLHCI